MDSKKDRLQLILAALLFLSAVFLVWYLLFAAPARNGEPAGTLVKNGCERLVEA